MVRFIKVVNTFDKITDCIPLVSTIKNAGILLYQAVHKVDKSALPIKASWSDDIKIHVLTKDRFIARASMIPIVGNLLCLMSYAIFHVIKHNKKNVNKPYLASGYLRRALSAEDTFGIKKHDVEVIALYLARKPQCSENKLISILYSDIAKNNPQISNLILNSKSNWTHNHLHAVLGVADETTAIRIYNKNIPKPTEEHAVTALYTFIAKSNIKMVNCILDCYPSLDKDMDKITDVFHEAAFQQRSNVVSYLFERFPNISEQVQMIALAKARRWNHQEIVDLILAKSPHLKIKICWDKVDLDKLKTIQPMLYAAYLEDIRKD